MAAKKSIRLFVLAALCLLLCLAGLPHPSLARPSQQANGPSGCWRVVPTPAIGGQYSQIAALSASSPNDVWAVGNSYNGVPGNTYSGFVLRWDGSAWGFVSTPVLTRTYSLSSIKVLSPNDVWAVGTLSDSKPNPNPVSQTSPDLFVVHWDGAEWKVSLFLESGGIPASLDATSDDNVWVVGSAPIDQSGGFPVILHYNGRSWNDLAPPNKGITNPYSKVLAISKSDVWIAGEDLLHWNGQNLGAPITYPQLSSAQLGMAATSSNDVWLTGGGGPAFAYHWNGATWSPVQLGNLGRFYDAVAIAIASADDAWTTSSYGGGTDGSGLLAHWDGKSWTAVPNTVPGFSSSVSDITAAGDQFWAGGERVLDASGQNEAFLMRYTNQPCQASGPERPLNPPVPLPGTGSAQFITGQSTSGIFLKYWQEHGGLQQQGYPISGVLGEQSDLNGQLYTVQYFERAVFEYHPENRGTPFEVLLAQLGTFQYRQKYPNGAPNQRANQDPGTVFFLQTGKHLGGTFLKYWQEHGGLQQQGYPISEEFTEVSDLDGKPYTVQYFERAVFEWHPENQPPYNVLLSQLGHFRYDQKYNSSQAQTIVPRRIADTILPTTLHGGGNDLVWDDMRDNGYNGQMIYSYNAAQNLQLPISQPLTAPDGLPLATNGSLAFWTRRDIDRRYLEGYDFRTRTEARLYQPDTVSSPDFRRSDIALDQTTLYYTDDWEGHTGIFAQNLATGDERQIFDKVPVWGSLVAGDGMLLWTEERGSAPNMIRTLRLYRADTGSITTLATGIGAFTGYGVSGDYAVYSFYSTIATQTTYLYNVQTGARKVIALGAASDPVIRANRVAWARWPSTESGESDGWKIETYDIASGATRVVASGLRATPSNLVLLTDGKIAYAADNDLTMPGSELYVLDLDTSP